MREEEIRAVVEPLLPLDFEPHESQTIKNAALRERSELAGKIAQAVMQLGVVGAGVEWEWLIRYPGGRSWWTANEDWARREVARAEGARLFYRARTLRDHQVGEWREEIIG